MLHAKCKDCAHCDIEKLICRPGCKDFKEEYKLEEEDLEKEENCDFFKKKKEDLDDK